MKVLNNKVYYIDNENKFIEYDYFTKERIIYSLDGVNIHANTIILPGKDYSIISDFSNTIKINMNDRK